MILNRVTITGADDSVDPLELSRLSDQYPFVEWGLLFGSGGLVGRPRFPSRAWCDRLRELTDKRMGEPIRLSAHLCSHWVRSLVLEGHFTWMQDYCLFAHMFRRIQLNFHGQYHRACAGFYAEVNRVACSAYDAKEVIFQHDGANDALLDEAMRRCHAPARLAPLFDRSGGAGVLPASWPEARWPYQGYAGGLSPENVAEQLKQIETAAKDRTVWIDVETRVRSADDQRLDLDKVRAFLEAAKPWVAKP